MPDQYSPQIVISAAPGVTEYLYLALYESSAPNLEVANSGQLAPPHNASRQIIGDGVNVWQLNPVIHLAKLFITDGISTAGTLIANFELDPRYPGVEIKADWFIYADEEPGLDSNTSQFTDPSGELDGWDYTVDIRSFGKLDDGVDSGHVEIDKTAPGYNITIPDYLIQPGELHIISFAPKIIDYNPTTGSGALFGDAVLVTSDLALAGSDYGKMHILASLTSTLTLTLPAIDAAPVNKLFMFTSGIGSHINAVIESGGSEKIDWNNEPLDEIILGQSETLWLFKWIDPDDSANKRWKVAQASDGIIRVGEIISDYNNDKTNLIFADGALLDRDVYPRLWAYVQGLDASMIVSDAAWSGSATEQGKYSTGDGSTTFRIPKLFTPGFLRGVDNSTRKAASKEAEAIGPHFHYTLVDQEIVSSGFPAQPTVSTSMARTYSKTGTGKESYYTVGHANAPTISKTSDGGGTETIPANIGVYLLIRI